jgi:predicted nucleic acid-binding protein
MIAIDSSVLIDLLGDDARADAAEACLRLALGIGPVVVCDVVVSEVTGALGHGSEVMDVVEEMGIRFAAIDQRAAIRAGEMQRKYQRRLRGAVQIADLPRTIPDFLVGAHAMLQCRGLITRDAEFFRDYFKGLKLIEPGAA